MFNAAIDLQHWSQIIDIIINLARQKSWLREECGWILYQAILYLDKAGHDTNYIQLIIDKVHENGLMRTSDGVAICIAAMESGQNVRLPKGDWQYDNPLHHKGKAALAAILKESSRIPSDMNGSESKISQKGNWSSKLHFSWQVIISHLLGHHSSGIKCQSESLDELDIAGFWDECVDSEHVAHHHPYNADRIQKVSLPPRLQTNGNTGGSCSSKELFRTPPPFQHISLSLQI